MPTFTSVTNSATILNDSGLVLNVGKLLSLPSANRRPDYEVQFVSDNSQALEVYDVLWRSKDRFIESLLGHSSNISFSTQPKNVSFDGSTITATTAAASATITITGFTVQAVDVDRLLVVYSGANFIAGTYKVVSTGASTWTLDRNVSSAAASGLVAKSAGKGLLLRTPPAQHREYPWLYAVEARIMEGIGIPGKGQNGQLYFYDTDNNTDGYARMAITYRALDYQVESDGVAAASSLKELSRYVSRYYTYASQSIELPGQSFKFVSDNQPIVTGFAKVLPTKELTYIWREVPEVPEMNIEGCIGSVNSVLFDNCYPAETLLFEAPNTRRYRATTGKIQWEISYKFKFRPTGWNVAYRRNAAGGPRFEAVVANDGSGLKPYTSVDFAKLFEVPSITTI